MDTTLKKKKKNKDSKLSVNNSFCNNITVSVCVWKRRGQGVETIEFLVSVRDFLGDFTCACFICFIRAAR